MGIFPMPHLVYLKGAITMIIIIIIIIKIIIINAGVNWMQDKNPSFHKGLYIPKTFVQEYC